ncbi:hypothetical protein SLEP1_g24370 [Rubroshorea leprosula]|uniref:THUMP domain-containing protein n=1 Tax=Rubroshorea leprosula TaxID=152421 RepID=A0AAV5JFH2_9ROSI|nr:hypothetical protein SLEP1_g24370 [Rubroshorea leprosula]
MAAEEEGRDQGMMPWEQHAKVISIPRFDYNAPSSLLQRSHSGFLITSTIKREKSATKEAISILEKYIRSSNSGISKCEESPHTNAETKRRKLCTEENDGKVSNVIESKDTTKDAGGLSKDECASPTKTDRNVASDCALSLVKLTRSGLLLLTFPEENSPNTAAVLSDIFQALESGSLKSPLWCHRIFPIQATCNLNERELKAVISKLVLQFVNDKQNKLARPVKFAVAFNRRGIESTEAKLKNSDQFDLLDRMKCFDVVAAAVKEVVSDSAVDLKSPELSVLVELLPLSGVPNGSLVVAVSVLPQNLVSTKPRLCIKPLVSESNTRKARS